MPAMTVVPQMEMGSCVQVPDAQSASVEQNAWHAGVGSLAREAHHDPATHRSPSGHAAPTASVPSGTHAISPPAAPHVNVHF